MRAPRESSPEDPELRVWMSEYQAGRAEAFDRLHDALARDVRAYLKGLCRDEARADDLLQETFLQMHRSRATHTPGLPVRPWVFAIAKRVCLMHFRSSRRRAHYEDLANVDREELSATTMQVDRVNARQQIESALRQLPRNGRLAFVLHHLFGLTFNEIGGRLGVTTAAAKMNSSRAARAMKGWLTRSRDE